MRKHFMILMLLAFAVFFSSTAEAVYFVAGNKVPPRKGFGYKPHGSDFIPSHGYHHRGGAHPGSTGGSGGIGGSGSSGEQGGVQQFSKLSLPEDENDEGTLPPTTGGMWEEDEELPPTVGGMLNDDWLDDGGDGNPDPEHMPEPASIILTALGLFGVGVKTLRRKYL